MTKSRDSLVDPTFLGRAVLVLLLALAAVSALPAAAKSPRGAAHHGKSQQGMTINLVNAEIASAVQAVAAATGRNFIVDPRVKGQITLQFERPVPPSKVFDAMLTQLRLAGYSVVEQDGVFRVVPEADARLQTTPVGVGSAQQAIPGRGDQVVTQVFQLRNQSANNLLGVLRPLISPNNTINVDAGSNSLVITDYADNLHRLARIIAGLDQPSGSDVDIVPLRWAVATELAPTLQKLVDMQVGAAGAPGSPQAAATAALLGAVGGASRTVIVADANTNALILRASNGAQLLQVEAMIRKLDRPVDGSNIHVVYLHNSDAGELARVLRGVLATTSAGGNAATPVAGQNTNPAPKTQPVSSGMTSGSTGSSMGGGLGSQAPDFAQGRSDEGVTLPQGGSVYADASMNALIINAPQPLYQQLRAVIDKLDVRRAQVYVEALIAEVDANRLAQLGIQWQAIAGSAGGNNALYVGNNSGVAGANILNLQAGIASGGTVAQQALSTIGGGLNLGIAHSVAGKLGLGALANFLQTDGGANILSAPKIMTLDNEEAKILVGQNVPFLSGSYQTTSGSSTNPFQTYDRQDIGLTLKVRPQITAGDTLKLDVYQEISAIDQANSNLAAGLITTTKRSIQTSVLIDDGQTIVLGGLMQNELDDKQDKIPGLGDLPGLGALFRANQRQHKKTDLLVFLHPVIVRDADATGRVSANDYDRIQRAQKANKPEPKLGIPDMPLPVLPDMPRPGKDASVPARAASVPAPAASAPAPAASAPIRP